MYLGLIKLLGLNPTGREYRGQENMLEHTEEVTQTQTVRNWKVRKSTMLQQINCSRKKKEIRVEPHN